VSRSWLNWCPFGAPPSTVHHEVRTDLSPVPFRADAPLVHESRTFQHYSAFRRDRYQKFEAGWQYTGHTLNDVTRNRLLSRYSSVGLSARCWRTILDFKLFVWAFFLKWTHLVKRLMDITGAIILMTIISPLLLIFAALVKITSAGPVFFKQQRVGAKGQQFQMYKFRSMYRDAEERLRELLPHNEVPGGVIFKMKNDPRITPIGAFMRRWSIDELPQLWNVLKGDMSLVGPRPPLPSEVKSYTLPQRRRLDVTPGLTCTWQVSGRCDIPFERQVELDVDYIECQSLKLDLKLLFQTVIAVLQHRGAY
jgi:lipopolysaccharide/colanic/teichoic acid biosynthesis glycosyltransferase